MIDGYNATVFAYGQTASGKTHTMRGQVHTLPGSTEEEQGIIPLAVHDLMGQVAKLSSEREFVVRVSYLEVGAGATRLVRGGTWEEALPRRWEAVRAPLR